MTQPSSDSPIPELVLRLLHQKGLQRVAYLVSHVGVRQVQTSQHLRLQVELFRLIAVNHLTHKHVDKHDVRWIDKSNILKRQQGVAVNKGFANLIWLDAVWAGFGLD